MPFKFKGADGNIHIIEDSERTECEIWSRVMGYYRPVSDWNIGKRQEHKDRMRFSQKYTFP